MQDPCIGIPRNSRPFSPSRESARAGGRNDNGRRHPLRHRKAQDRDGACVPRTGQRTNHHQPPPYRHLLRPRNGTHDRTPADRDDRNVRPVRYPGHGSRRGRQRSGGAPSGTESRGHSSATTRAGALRFGAPVSSPAMPARSNARKSDCTRPASGPNTPSGSSTYRTGGSSNGRTADSDSASLGSNPSPPAKHRRSVSPWSSAKAGSHGLRLPLVEAGVGGSRRIDARTARAIPAAIMGRVSTCPIVTHPNARYPRCASGTRTSSTRVRASP